MSEHGQPGGGGEVARPVVVSRRPVVRRPDVDTMFSVNPDGSRNALHPADVRGRFQRWKHALWVLLIAVYLAVPWLRIDGRPLLLIDIAARHFYLAGETFNATDFWLAFFFVTGLGFALFVAAALFGRAWCGYACPQTVFLEGVFRRLERWIEGPAAARAKLDRAPFAARFWRRGPKLVIYLALSAVIAHSLLGYFMPTETLLAALTSSPAAHPVAFAFVLATTGAVFFDFTWFREQMCIVICPYGRLQGALYDQDTVLVGYDARRGEPRGHAHTAGVGDCVDCYRCVSVCPTGIDIRNGTQLECVGCANCIDACDEVMTKLARAPGLVRYDSQRGFATGARRFWRGRVAFYAALLLAGVSAFGLAMTRRRPFEAALLRSPGPAYLLEQGRVHGVFDLQLTNKRPGPRTFTITVVGPAAATTVVARTEVTLESLAMQRVPVDTYVPVESFVAGLRVELLVRCSDPGGDLTRTATAVLLGPSAN